MITIDRPTQDGTGNQDFHIYANGKKICEIGNGEKIQVDLSPGDYEITGKVMWFKSKVFKTRLEDGEHLMIKGPKFAWLMGLAPMFIFALLAFFDLDSDIVLWSFIGLSLAVLLTLFLPPFKNNYIKISKVDN